jgi:hypothetical protein
MSINIAARFRVKGTISQHQICLEVVLLDRPGLGHEMTLNLFKNYP